MAATLPRGVLAVIRTTSAEHALTIGRALAGTGVGAVEVTFTVPDAAGVIARLVKEGVPNVGGGTVRTVGQVRECAEAGGGFVVSPHTDAEVVRAGVEAGLVVVPGALTPSEVVAAVGMGAHAAKVFPIGAVGGVGYVRSVLEPLPDVPLVVSGGIAPEEVPEYLAAGAVAACLGKALWREEDVVAGDVEAVRRYADAVLDVAAPR
ncbi:bifunctional 4-hydroxy-2-oxoglutarate aldolase/2-dehydro-3-deoxy-phosphogluconate aldolase [Sphaerisporangium rubeum]|uniref:2-dehydro-3-deoxyphosphogluconate aldolase/(4S)-4-hydroxy-2-oxoglutarate aldolase n=1 Tax=Sphaerisporangium rubeum TaxID=321317 RepID=A0A7X0IID7_9ACTN|nr:bifunctional 4-hydroxy-2-oxoglutarate aldolase/2-dehydro-3-deoxy-phosphogluconate aldolase [Sphaerisporangium rubeum]MBB6475726.1 2-dehydro-3-deoxyphosphogluconate aldolase/(4S)-4-hydroxy-2-oxoglutarate aldolase [Sphaerisporangium rubeum]